MVKRSKRSLKRRRQTAFTLLFMLLFTIIFIFTIGPFLWRIEQLREAERVYDIAKVNEELQWLKAHGGVLNKLGMIQEANLWLDLNVGKKDLESKLANYQDEQHQFWLFLYCLQNEKITEAQNTIASLGMTPRGRLGQGIVYLAQGSPVEANHLLTDGAKDWGSLPTQEQTLRHLTLSRAAMLMGDRLTAQTELAAAQKLQPNNPACLSAAFDAAIEDEEWAKASELCQSIVAQTWWPKTTLFETKRAILAIQENRGQELSDSLAALQNLPQGEACISYVHGIQAIAQGQQQAGKNLLTRALNSGLEGELKADAQKAIAQVTERQKADQTLKVIADGNIE